MKKDTVVELRRPAQGQDLLSTMLRDGAQQLVAQAVQAEFEEFLARFAGDRAEDGRAAVVRNGFQPEREILTGLGPVDVRIPKARSRAEAAAVFHSRLVPPYVRRAKSVDAVLPWLYLHGVSTGNMQEALAALLGSAAAGLSASVVARLKGVWMDEYRRWRRAKLGQDRWVYLWVDGIYSGPHHPAAPGGGRRRARFLGCPAGDLSRNPSAEMLGAQDGERAQLSPEIPAAQGQSSAARDLDGGDQGAGSRRLRAVRCRLRRQVSQGGRMPGEGPRDAARLL